MKYLWILALLGSASLVFAQAQSWEKRTDPKKTVVDYFLLCPGIIMEDDGRFGFGLMDGGDPALFPIYFEGKKKLLHGGYKARELSVDSVVVDIPDAYISITGVNFSKRYTLTFVSFDRQGKRDVPAYSYIEQGDDLVGAGGFANRKVGKKPQSGCLSRQKETAPRHGRTVSRPLFSFGRYALVAVIGAGPAAPMVLPLEGGGVGRCQDFLPSTPPHITKGSRATFQDICAHQIDVY